MICGALELNSGITADQQRTGSQPFERIDSQGK
jgi:hypothetical protein